MILYALLGLVIFYLLFFAFIKIRFRFWSSQPVFHLYNLFYWLWPCGIIQHGQPPKTKFYNAKVITKNFQDFSAEKKALFYTLIKLHFLNAVSFEPKEDKNNKSFMILTHSLHSHTSSTYSSTQVRQNSPSK